MLVHCLVAIMPLWNVEHRVFVYDSFVRSGESVTEVQRLFRRRFNVPRHGDIPSRNTILRWVNALRSGGSLMKRQPPGPRRTVRTPENVERVRQAVLTSPRRSVCRHSAALRISNSSVRRILHRDLGFHPYKMSVVHKLTEGDYPQRAAFAEAMLQILEDEPNAILIMSDEAHFHLNGVVNRQNFRYWACENPRTLHELPLHSPKVTVWCGVGKFGIVGPYFFEENGNTVTVTADRYVNMVKTFLKTELRRRRINLPDVYFQQDGATAHTARVSMAAVRQMFPNRVISRFGDLHWPPRSPDLSMCDFFLWGYLKSLVYETKPRTLAELRQAIEQNIAQIDRQLLERVEANFRERLHICQRENGHHLNDIIFRT